MDSPAQPFELARLFLGDDPALFYLEIVFRTLLIYGWTLALIRWLGGRSLAQLSLVDFLLVIALGSAVGDATFYADVPLGQAMLVILVVVAATKGLERFVMRVPAASPIVDDDPILVLHDGRILLDCLRSREMPVATFHELLRHRDVTNLGELRAVWIESGGSLSILRCDRPQPGLPIMPPHELAAPPAPGPGEKVCCVACGARQEGRPAPCPDCGGETLAKAILGPGPLS